MQQEVMVQRDLELRLKALEEERQLRSMAQAALEQLKLVKSEALQADFGSAQEQLLLKEAAEASERLSTVKEELLRVERELRRTAYLVKLISQ